ncbi:MAG: hypothetical protein ACRELE_12635 [Gemmatimonadales bacterium]
MKILRYLLLAGLCIAGLFFFIHPKRAHAIIPRDTNGNDCPVTATTPNATGGASVTFDCGTGYSVTIQEPVWP